jgi:hypothetical protein
MDFTLTQEQYEALIALAREGSTTAFQARTLDEFLKVIETANGVTRSGLWVRWQEMHQPLPSTTSFPDTWPPELEHYIELVTRQVARADVETMIAARATSPVNIMVTKDPGKTVGWTSLDDYFVA